MASDSIPEILVPQFSPSEKIATSINTSPQKCFVTVKDNVENSTKIESAKEIALCVKVKFTAQSYKILQD
ncbi:hypothetical protein GCM10008085_25460 [Winogradskyella epiphytica]|nr:hypothetical protein GCM10008085_25460 [Winogradskyella epiphytica]